MANTAPLQWVVRSGKSGLVPKLHYRTTATKKGSMSFVVRIKILKPELVVSNNEDACSKCNSRIGFGTGGSPDDSNSCGNEAGVSPDNGYKHIKAMGYILVQ